MDAEIKLLHCGNSEELKLGVHGAALALAVIMGAYNTAAWLVRRQRHLAVNSILYSVLTVWEMQHVRHHWAEMSKQRRPAKPARTGPVEVPLKPAA